MISDTLLRVAATPLRATSPPARTCGNQRLLRHLAVAILAFPLLAAVAAAADEADGPIGTIRQPLVRGTLVDEQTQEAMGLLTLSSSAGSCSASMLNDYWAITAAHCVFDSTTGMQVAPADLSITSNWPSKKKTARAVRIVPFATVAPWAPSDIALVQVGRYDFGRPDQRERKLYDQRPSANMGITVFGRGIDQLAAGSGPTATPSSSDGQYRSAPFSISSISPNASSPPTTFTFQGSDGASIAGGDSGGPAFVEEWDNPDSTQRKLEWQLIGVNSACETTCADGKSCAAPNTWTWVTAVKACSDAAIFPLRETILDTIRDIPPDPGATGTFPKVPDEVVKRKRALYAMSIDEPLIAPAGAAIDVQLTFKRCHDPIYLGQGCPVEEPLEQWSYNPATHQMLHVESGKCLNISGARHDSGSPIILYPCLDAPNEKWTVVAPGGTSEWTIKSDLTGMCLHAVPGTTGGPRNDGMLRMLGSPAKLVQAVCDGSNAQQFRDVDSDWYRRNGPR